MEFLIITGVSGAGKSKAVTSLEDIGYYCVDNIPLALVPGLAKICSERLLERVVIVTDARGGNFFAGFNKCLNELKACGFDYKILYLEAGFEVLVNRYKETRRKHPLLEDAGGSLDKAIETELELLSDIRGEADYIIDTTLLSPSAFKERLNALFSDNPSLAMSVLCTSFGYKHGGVNDADLMFDVRCLPNPFYIEELRYKTGLDSEVLDYVFKSDAAKTLLKKILDIVDFLLPLYKSEGKSQVVIAIGCTGGNHRSVAFSQAIYEHIKNNNYRASVSHRDIDKKA